MQTKSHSPFTFPCGLSMKNRFMLAPMTNTQSHDDGQLSEDEHHWLAMRARGQFGLVITCASHVQENGRGFPGQLGIFSDIHMPGHQRLTTSIKSEGSLAVIQLHHAGMRSPAELIQGKPVCPSDNTKYGARALTLPEVEELGHDFISAAIRAQKSGYDGVEVHGAHGYILCQFLSADINQRTDQYGGSLKNRSRILFEIVHGIRKSCGPQFLVSVRLSPERFGMDLLEIKEICQRLNDEQQIDFLDISLWDAFKYPEAEAYKNKTLLQHFADMPLNNVGLTVAGKINNGHDVKDVLSTGVDFVTIGRAAILHHDFPSRVMADPDFETVSIPVSAAYLRKEGLGPDFINYMRRWPGFVEGEE